MTATVVRWQRAALLLAGSAFLLAGLGLLFFIPSDLTTRMVGAFLNFLGLGFLLKNEPLALWLSGLWFKPAAASSRTYTLPHVHPRLYARAVVAALVALPVLYFLSTAWFCAEQTWLLWQLHQHGKLVQAQIINNEPGSAWKASNGRLLYAYRVGNVAYTGQIAVRPDTYMRFRLGTRLLVTYLPSLPSYSRVGKFGQSAAFTAILSYWLFELLGLVYLSVPALLWWQKVRREQYLASYGVPKEGIITHSRRYRRWGKVVYKVTYRYRADKEYEGTALVKPPQRADSSIEPLLVDFPIYIIYDRRYPWDSRPILNLNLVTTEPSGKRSSSAQNPSSIHSS
ncbi:MAG TPA: DUF3592 domain-containing protein [Chthonomonas sp.]|uniref:DUF3592 domain-containing protein n=1 Tax=Chthonomonas sp. TaxID=2282153 RepID=UPI002B4AB1A5|nr:DUF3592 domain-containing protein [Chthonomonas sp.]HLI49468.1 DUF3592 domain-containing protein [Chthonomonas sp.]